MKYSIPDEAQVQLLTSNGIAPDGIFVLHDCEEYIKVQNYKTGDEITIRRNVSKLRGAKQ